MDHHGQGGPLPAWRAPRALPGAPDLKCALVLSQNRFPIVAAWFDTQAANGEEQQLLHANPARWEVSGSKLSPSNVGPGAEVQVRLPL